MSYIIPNEVMDKLIAITNAKSVLDENCDIRDHFSGCQDDAFELGFDAGELATARMVVNEVRKFREAS